MAQIAVAKWPYGPKNLDNLFRHCLYLLGLTQERCVMHERVGVSGAGPAREGDGRP
jgi:hypothetical protein